MKKSNFFASALLIAFASTGAYAQLISNGPGGSLLPNSSTTNKNVGIGTTTPTAGLHLKTTVAATTLEGLLPNIKIDRNDGTNQGGVLSIGISGSGFGTALLGGGSAFFKIEDPYGNSMNRDMGFSTNGAAAQFVIKNNGFVGIGTEAPTAKLHSIGTARLESLPSSIVNTMVISTDANGNLAYQPASSLFSSSTSWLLGGNLLTTAADYIGTGDANPFIIGTSATERARFTPTGEMGIGTTTPTAQLEVKYVPPVIPLTDQTAIKGFGKSTGVYGEANHMTVGQTAQGIAATHTEAIGVFGKGIWASNTSNGNLYGVVGSATGYNPLNNIGVYGEAQDAIGYNTGVIGTVKTTNGIFNAGVIGSVGLNTTAVYNRAISGHSPVAPNHYAGYFDGHVSVMSGNVGVNTLANRHKLNVHDGALMLSGNVPGFGGPQLLFSDDTTSHPNGKWAIEYIKPIASGIGARPSMGGLNFWKPNNPVSVPGQAYNYTLFLKDDGKIGMGVSDDTDPANASLFCANALPNGYRLYVNGGILTTKVKVANYCSAAWADYVFAKDYKLKSLAEVETFIKANKHLPNIPSGDQIEKEGLDVAEMQAKQMEKIEELTLYMIEMKKEIDSLKKQNEGLQGKISKN